jgi:hypothetical protein
MRKKSSGTPGDLSYRKDNAEMYRALAAGRRVGQGVRRKRKQQAVIIPPGAFILNDLPARSITPMSGDVSTRRDVRGRAL